MKFETDFQMKVRDAFAASHEPEAQHLLATMYWSGLVSCFVLVVIASLMYGAWEFFAAPSEEEALATPRPQAAFNRTTLQETLQGLEARTTRFEERLEAPSTVRDPS